MFKIGDFSKICRVPVSALRYYADIGLLAPEHIDKFTGYRYYSLEQLPRLNRILALKDLGFTLEQIQQQLAGEVNADQLAGMLALREAEIAQHIQEEQARLARVATRLRQIQQEGKMPDQEIVLKKLDAMHILSIREVIPSPEHVGLLLGTSAEPIMTQSVPMIGAPFTVFHSEAFTETDLDIEIVFPVAPSVKDDLPINDERKLSVGELDAVEEAACVIHTGGFETIETSYAAIGQWLESNGYQLNGAIREAYLRPHTEEEAGITEIQFPVKKV